MDEEEVIPRIAIIGAGPIGLEAAMYARYLGYEVAVFEKGSIADHVRQWAHVRMFSPFAMNRSPLGCAALQAQSETALPAADALLTGAEYFECYLLPLAKSDLIADCIHESTEVLSVARDGIIKTDTGIDRSEYPFRLLVSQNGEEDVVVADFVLDASGVFGSPCWLGHGGLPAIGEIDSNDRIIRCVPDVIGSDRAKFADKRTLVVGNGYSAATTIVAISELAKDSPNTNVTWITRRALESELGPMPINSDDELKGRLQLSEAANRVIKEAKTTDERRIVHHDQSTVFSIDYDADSSTFHVVLVGGIALAAGNDEGTLEIEFDQIVSHVGFRPQSATAQELQVQRDASTDATTPITSEPGFFVVGIKSHGRNSDFLLADGLQQVRDAFAVIADREELDLYATMANLVE